MVWVPNDVRNGDDQRHRDPAQLDAGRASPVPPHDVPAGPVEAVDPAAVGDQRRRAPRAPRPATAGPAPGRWPAARSMSRGTATSDGRAVERARAPGAPSAADAERDDRARGELVGDRRPATLPPAHAATTAGSRSRHRTSSRSESSSPLMVSAIGP